MMFAPQLFEFLALAGVVLAMWRLILQVLAVVLLAVTMIGLMDVAMLLRGA